MSIAPGSAGGCYAKVAIVEEIIAEPSQHQLPIYIYIYIYIIYNII